MPKVMKSGMKYTNRVLVCPTNKALPNPADSSLDRAALYTDCTDDTGLVESLHRCPGTNTGRQS
jgi:hypothetical protein